MQGILYHTNVDCIINIVCHWMGIRFCSKKVIEDSGYEGGIKE